MTDEGDRPAEPGWYPDPWHEARRRYWTGSQWTALTFPDRTAGPDAGAAARAGHPDPFATGARSTGTPPTPPAPAWVGPDGTPAPTAPTTDAPAVAATTEPPGRGRWAVLLTASAVVLALALVGGFVATRGPSASDAASVATPRATPAPTGAPSTPTPATPSTPTPSTPTPSTPTPSGPGSSSPGPTDRTGPGTTVTPGALGRLGLRQSDVGADVLVLPIAGGTEVAGERTLDLCDADYPSEAARTDRVQVAGFEPDSTTRLSTEAVRYRDAGAVEQARAEVRAAAADCGRTEPGTSARPTGDDWPDVRGVQRLAYELTRTGVDGSPEHYVVVYLSRGNVLLGVYFPAPAGPQLEVAGARSIPDIVTVFARRLAELPPAGLSGASRGGDQPDAGPTA